MGRRGRSEIRVTTGSRGFGPATAQLDALLTCSPASKISLVCAQPYAVSSSAIIAIRLANAETVAATARCVGKRLWPLSAAWTSLASTGKVMAFFQPYASAIANALVGQAVDVLK